MPTTSSSFPEILFVFLPFASLVYWRGKSGELSFISLFFQPPSILPISFSGVESAIYCLLSKTLISHDTCRVNLSRSNLPMAFSRNGIFLVLSRYLAMNIVSSVSRKSESIFIISTRSFLERWLRISCQSL